jgi:DNA-binding NtrC family response regulator
MGYGTSGRRATAASSAASTEHRLRSSAGWMAQPETEFIGISAAIRHVEVEMDYSARSDAKVLITGESGVGKEIAARLIHQRSQRAHQPIVTINCAGIPDSLLESELFGHVRGSFTNAYRDRLGLFEMADGGTIFMDEVGEMSLRMQALLLRFLETGEIQRVGAHGVQSRVNVRVIAATNRDLLERIGSRDFREDLYYRLNVIHITVPPLRARREDIPMFLRHFFASYAERHGVTTPELAPETLSYLVAYDWPGNVRELKNLAERLIVRSRADVIPPASLPPEILASARASAVSPPPSATSLADSLFERMVDRHESFWSLVYPLFTSRDLTRGDLRQIVARGLEQTRGNYKVLAELFNMTNPGDYKRFLNFLRRHGCEVPFQRFRTVKGQSEGDDLIDRRDAAE